MESNIILIVILFIAVLGKADTVAIASCLLLIAKLLHIDDYIFPTLENKGVWLGLILLTASILVPIAKGSTTSLNIKNVFTSYIGITAFILSLFTTYLSGLGLKYLTVQGHSDVMPALILGAVAAAALLGGVPVGPLITSGMLALFSKIFNKQ